MADTKTLGEALNEATDESLGTQDVPNEGDEETQTADTATDEGAEEGETEDATEDSTEEDGEEEGDDEEAPADEEFDIFDTLTPEQNQKINENPELKGLRKALLKGYESKTTELKQLIQLGEAWKQNPRLVVQSLASSLNLTIAEAKAVAAQAGAAADAAAAQAPAADPLAAVNKKLEALFGEKLGPKVREVFEEWADARIGKRVTADLEPVRNKLGEVVNTNEQNRMLSEESSFKQRMGEKITPAVEKRIVELGNSGKYVPGKGMSPQEYLDALYDLATAQISRETAKKATGNASKALAKKIETNRKDVEPSGRSGRGGAVVPKSRISEARSISEAIDIASAEMEADGL